MNQKIVLGALALVVIAGGALVALRGSASPQAVGSANSGGKYCAGDGTFTDTMPIQSHRSYCIKSNAAQTTYTPNTPAVYSFSIVDDQGNTLKNFAITHTKQMHVIVVRKDLANFQHLHPDYDPATGVFTLSNLTFPTGGPYRVFADFAPEGGMKDPEGMPLGVTLPEDVNVGNMAAYQSQPLGSDTRSETVNGYQVKLSTNPEKPVTGSESMFSFALSQNGKPVTDLQEYLGALGHSVVLREDTLDFIHAHPVSNDVAKQNGTVEFMVALPEAGKYKVFTQFQRASKVFVTDFVVSAAEGTGTPAPVMQHN